MNVYGPPTEDNYNELTTRIIIAICHGKLFVMVHCDVIVVLLTYYIIICYGLFVMVHCDLIVVLLEQFIVICYIVISYTLF